MRSTGLTPSQTIGPYHHLGLSAPGNVLVKDGDAEAVVISGTVVDGHGSAVDDALIEIWQTDFDGSGSPWSGFGRCPTDPTGRYRFVARRPAGQLAAVAQAPHLALLVHARGLLQHLVTRMYFPENERDFTSDPVLREVPSGRRATLIGERIGAQEYRFDIRLQGVNETVFLDV